MRRGMIGLGRMGANRERRLMQEGHECVVHDTYADALIPSSLEDSVEQLASPRAVWVMLPAAAVGEVMAALAALFGGHAAGIH